MKVKSVNTPNFVTYPVTPSIVRIFGVGQEVMTLVEGEEKALLFDTGLGYGNIREFAESMTDKPVICVISHGHGDHVGGNACFEEVYIHPKDMELAASSTLEERKKNVGGLCRQRGYAIETDLSPMVPDPVDTRMIPVEDGYVFHLGGIDLKVVEMPGHTAGSIGLLNEKERYILVGDAICRGTLVGLPGQPTINEFADMLRKFIEKYKGKIDFVLPAHGPCPEQFRIFEGNLDAAEGYISGKYEPYLDEFGKIIGLNIWRIKQETAIEGFCTDGMIGNVTVIPS